ncbi:lanthionine synthetase C family protein [Embleya sp. NBC_00896]|uniref:lanthionine synthetase C family protein n=1 Tax=Embleya sp. NBC_00896 TaxID=2975961 RepID=UPI002F908B00|nr:lanthionine synthetase C family protein [Embleya sp. NBC_00896]
MRDRTSGGTSARPRHADEARAVVARVLDTLADPAAVAADTRIPGAAAWDGEDLPLWVDLSLSSGFPGVSLAFSGTTPRGPDHAARAHDYLARSMGVLARERFPAGGIYLGPGSVAVAALIAHRATGGYVSAVDRLDDHQRRVVRAALARPRLDAPVATNGEFETVRGLSGIGRYLLARGANCAEELRMVLSYLVELAEGEVTHRGHKVPRWWAMAAPKLGQEHELPDGHLNLGLSHGVAGPLALLSLASREGIEVSGQRAAIENIVALLARCAVPDGDAVSWPAIRTLEQWVTGPAPNAPAQRPSWCYGAPGVSRAIQLAALALDRPDWHDLTRRSLAGLLATPVRDWPVDDPALCHGWSGLMHLLGLLAEHLDDDRLPDIRDELAALVLAQYREEHRFGFRSTMTHVPQGADVPAFLEGAAGVAMALDAYAEGRPAGGWDMALLVA